MCWFQAPPLNGNKSDILRMFVEQFFKPNSMKAISELYEVISMEQVDKFNKDMDVVIM